MKLPRKHVQIFSKVTIPALFRSKGCWTEFFRCLGLGDKEKRVLEEFSGTVPSVPVDVADPEPAPEDAEVWKALEEEGTAQGFIDDIQGLLDGR